MGRGGRRWTAGAVLLATLIAGCGDGGEPRAAKTAATDTADTAPTGGGDDLGAPFDAAAAVTAYGELLAASAITGGDALERTLRVTADDREAFDATCAPRWAHDLLDAVSSQRTLGVTTDGTALSVGATDVPITVEHQRVLHRVDAPCDGRLPQPDRAPVEPAPVDEPSSQQASSGSSPTPAPSPEPTPSSPSPAPSPERTPRPSTDAELTAMYDAHLAMWSSQVLLPMFDVVVATQQHVGEVGGGEDVQRVYDGVHSGVIEAVGEWSSIVPPESRETAHAALVDGLELWALELESLSLCAVDPAWEPCRTDLPALRERWQSRFREVTAVTGVPLPDGDERPAVEITPPSSTPSLPPGGFNIGDIRLPGEYEVRGSLD